MAWPLLALPARRIACTVALLVLAVVGRFGPKRDLRAHQYLLYFPWQLCEGGGMTYLLFLDESGHDHRNTPYEVRGGIALHATRRWPFIQSMRAAEESAFGCQLSHYGAEIKGAKLLERRRFAWAASHEQLDDEVRRKHVVGFLEKGKKHIAPHAFEFCAFGQASIRFAHDVFGLLREHGATLFASMIPRGVRKPDSHKPGDFLRKDHVFLLERYFYFLENREEDGLLIFDQTEKKLDREFVRQVHRYFTQTASGRYRAARLAPVPVFISSDMAYPMQAADVVIYAVNWGYRRPSWPESSIRKEVASQFRAWIQALAFDTMVPHRHDPHKMVKIHSIVRVGDPYEARPAHKKGGNAFRPAH